MVDGYLAHGRRRNGRSGRSASVIRVRHVTLPAGLSAFVRKDSHGGLEVFVSDALTADRQRTAVRLALRSIRGQGRRAGLFPVPVGLLLGAVWRSMRPITRALRSHAIVSSAAAFVAVAGAAALIAGLPQHHRPATAGPRLGRDQVHVAAPGRTHTAGKAGPGRRGRRTPGAPGGSAGAVPGPITATPAAPSAAPSASKPAAPMPSTSAAAPQQSTPSPTPTAAPSPSPSPASPGGVTCLVVLGVWVCF